MKRTCDIVAAAVATIMASILVGCATTRYASSKEFTLGPAEADGDCMVFLDLDGHRAYKSSDSVRFSQLEGLQVTPDLSTWLQQNGIDLFVQLVPKVKLAGSTTTAPGAHLRGVNLRGVAVLEDEAWRRSKADASGKSWPTPDPRCDVDNSRLLGFGVKAYRVLLRTQEGRLFALEQEEGQPGGVKIRYEEVAMR